MMKHAVIMICTLKEYPGCAKHRKSKLKRALNSFLKNNHGEKELILISDGCQETSKIYFEEYHGFEQIKYILAPEQPLKYPGFLRGLGLFYTDAPTISYLDSDDYLSPSFIKNAQSALLESKADIVYYDVITADIKREYMNMTEIIDENIDQVLKKYRWTRLPVKLQERLIGTPNICHKNGRWQPYNWHNWDGKKMPSEDWVFINEYSNILKSAGNPEPIKVDALGYYLCHYPIGGVDV